LGEKTVRFNMKMTGKGIMEGMKWGANFFGISLKELFKLEKSKNTRMPMKGVSCGVFAITERRALNRLCVSGHGVVFAGIVSIKYVVE